MRSWALISLVGAPPRGKTLLKLKSGFFPFLFLFLFFPFLPFFPFGLCFGGVELFTVTKRINFVNKRCVWKFWGEGSIEQVIAWKRNTVPEPICPGSFCLFTAGCKTMFTVP